MQSSGDIVNLDLGRPAGREAGYLHPAVIVTAQRILDAAPTVIQVVPLTSTLRGFHTEVVIEPDRANGLEKVVGCAVPTCPRRLTGTGSRHCRQRGATGVVANSRDDRRHHRPALSHSPRRPHNRSSSALVITTTQPLHAPHHVHTGRPVVPGRPLSDTGAAASGWLRLRSHRRATRRTLRVPYRRGRGRWRRSMSACLERG